MPTRNLSHVFIGSVLLGLTPFFSRIAMRLARKVFPYRQISDEFIPEMYDREKKQIDFLAFIILFISIGLFGYFGTDILEIIKVHYISIHPVEAFLFEISEMRLLCAVIIGSGLCSIFLEVILRQFWRQTFLPYFEATSREFQVDSLKAHRVACSLLIIGGVSLFVYILPTSFVIRENQLIFQKDLFSQPSIRSLLEIKSIATSNKLKSKTGEVIDRIHYLVIFSDGSSWASKNGMFEYEKGKYEVFFAVLAEKTNLPVSISESFVEDQYGALSISETQDEL